LRYIQLNGSICIRTLKLLFVEVVMGNLFENTENAFILKSDSELERAHFLFRMIANEPLVRIGTAVTNFALKVHLPVNGLIRATVFDHFCGGIDEEDCLPVVDKMFSKGVCSVLDYSVEGKEAETNFDGALEKTLKLLEFVKEKDAIPFAVFKPTGFGRFVLYQKLTENQSLTKDEQAEWNRVESRFDTVCTKAEQMGVSLLIDAEESWMQDAADELVERLMRKYNTKRTVVCNTLQMYRWDRMDYLKNQHEKANLGGYRIGYKLVRGAYMEKENDRAKEQGYATPICESKAATDKNFDVALRYVLDNLDTISLFAGTHNEESSLLLVDLMSEKGIENEDLRVWFGQLYGMSDHISYNLSERGYNVAKYLPFGPVRDVMPYLIRRAEENTSVAGQTSRELELIQREKARRRA
jgi:proline dehydrogenase